MSRDNENLKRDRKGKGRFSGGAKKQQEKSNLIEKIMSIRRVTKVVKGGRRLGFAAFVVVGDGNGKVGVASGKGREVAPAVSKALKRAQKLMIRVPMHKATLPYDTDAKFGASKVLLKPAARGTGVIAGGAVRAVMTACGIGDVLAKSLRASNPINVAYATIKALKQIKDAKEISKARGMSITKILRR